MAVLLSLCAALSYGLSDFLGGLVSRRASPWAVAFTSMLGGGVVILALAPFFGGTPRTVDAGWALLAGLGGGTGTAFLYRGLAAGRMGVVSPISGVGAALLPVLVGLAAGERPAALAWVGMVAAMPAIWLVAREPAPIGPDAAGLATTGAGVVDGVLSGLGFGTLFAALGQIPESSGLLPLALNQVAGAVVVAVVAAAARSAWLPRRALDWAGMLPGFLGATATVLFLVATQQGFLTISAVLTSLYPGFTVLLAAVLLRERIHGAQGAGLALCAVAVAFIAAA